jgi:hypothetical protein
MTATRSYHEAAVDYLLSIGANLNKQEKVRGNTRVRLEFSLCEFFRAKLGGQLCILLVMLDIQPSPRSWVVLELILPYATYK